MLTVQKVSVNNFFTIQTEHYYVIQKVKTLKQINYRKVNATLISFIVLFTRVFHKINHISFNIYNKVKTYMAVWFILLYVISFNEFNIRTIILLCSFKQVMQPPNLAVINCYNKLPTFFVRNPCKVQEKSITAISIKI